MSLAARPIAPSVWTPLEAELDRWHTVGRIARFWWRDDDAVAPSPALDRLLALAGPAPLALAVIPAGATEALARRLAAEPAVTVLQHGIAHTNHAAAPAKKAELGADRPPGAMLDGLVQARDRLARLFGAQFHPVLVPPWNRIAPSLVPRLAAAGFVGLSTAGNGAGPNQANSQIDPIDWHGTRRCRPAAELVALTVRELVARRETPEAPIGFLTHHLLDDAATEAFAGELAALVASHPAARWVGAREIWPA